MKTASVIGISRSGRRPLRSIVDPTRPRCSAAPSTFRNRGQSSSVLKAAFPVALEIGKENDASDQSPIEQKKKHGKWVDVFTHLGVVYIEDTENNREIYAHRRRQHQCWSTLQRGGGDAMFRFLVYTVYLVVVLLAQHEKGWSFLVSVDVHYMFWDKGCPGEGHVCAYYPKHYRHHTKTDLLLFVGVIGWVYAGLSLDVEIFEILYRKDVEFFRRTMRVAFTSVLLVIGHMLNGIGDVVQLMLLFTLTMALFMHMESFKAKSRFSVAKYNNTERGFLVFVILSIWCYSLIPTIITWADESSKSPEILWVVNFILFFLLWTTEIIMLWSRKCNSVFTAELRKALRAQSSDATKEAFQKFEKVLDAEKNEVAKNENNVGAGCCGRRSSSSDDQPPFSQLVSFQIICQILQDAIFTAYLTSVLMYSI